AEKHPDGLRLRQTHIVGVSPPRSPSLDWLSPPPEADAAGRALCGFPVFTVPSLDPTVSPYECFGPVTHSVEDLTCCCRSPDVPGTPMMKTNPNPNPNPQVTTSVMRHRQRPSPSRPPLLLKHVLGPRGD
ncbi:hypothetical protein Vafri_3500, partial [Volvox africanus]